MSDEDAVPLLLSRRAVRLLARGFKLGVLRESSLIGAEPTAEVSALLSLLDATARGRRHVFVSPPAEPATLEHGLREVFGTREAAAVLGCDTSHVRRLCLTGRLPARRIRGGWLIDSADLDSYRYGHEESSSGQRGNRADGGQDRRGAAGGTVRR
jgi:excisionase family DNA binding protein